MGKKEPSEVAKMKIKSKAEQEMDKALERMGIKKGEKKKKKARK